MAAGFLLQLTGVPWMPSDGALHGPVVDRLMFWNLVALCVAALIAHLWLGFAIFRRQSAVGKFPAMIRWGLIASFCLMYAWMALTAQRLWAANRYFGPSTAAMQVEVVGEQFQWYFRYPGTDAVFGITRPQLVNAAAGNPLGIDVRDPHGADDIVSSILTLPAGREVDLQLRSLDVIHGFFIPGMRLKENTVPGMMLHVHFTPVSPGTYPILCSQVCGLGHQRMQARLLVLPAADFDSWLAGREQAQARRTGQ
ncbi:MAG TPA: cytochrome C oxidase subunit II [Silvibacterium sp.]|nr:cytochrome C oxidase subunit II [Silvibacterium sp.]